MATHPPQLASSWSRSWSRILDRCARTGASVVTRIGPPAIAAAVVIAALVELRALDWRAVLAMLPRTPAFWLLFPIGYMTPVICDWLIYRRLWSMPVSGIGPMLRKLVGNDLLFGYVGEAYLYAWARRAGQVSRLAFGAVKDVAILSAAVGNLATLVIALVALPFLGMLRAALPLWAAVPSLAIILAPPLVALMMRRRLFTLPSGELGRIAAIHGIRAVTTIAMTALLWHLALPGVTVTWWLVFSALKLLVSRLPLISNKELVFAGITATLLGHGGAVTALMAMMATLTLATHVVMGLGLGAGGALRASLRLVDRSGRIVPGPLK